MAVTYPSTLPGPAVAPIEPAERRLLSTLPGARQSRPLSRNRLAQQTVEFVFAHDELAVFMGWLQDDLCEGGAWFASDWPHPQSGYWLRRFIGHPSFPVYHPTLGWRVSARCEVMPLARKTTYYTSWPYPLEVDEALAAALSVPLGGQLWVPPSDDLLTVASIPVAGALGTVLHSYPDARSEDFAAEPSRPVVGTLDVVLRNYGAARSEDLAAAPSRPLAGDLVTVLVVYTNSRPDDLRADQSIPIGGTLQ